MIAPCDTAALSAFLSDSESSFLGGAVFGTDLTIIDGVKKSSSSDIESNILACS